MLIDLYAKQLRNAGATIDNETKASVLLGGLRDTYKALW